MSTTVFKTEIVNGLCPACNFQVVLVSLANDHFRCTTCGSDLEQKINGKISYIPIMSNNEKDKIRLEATRDGEEI
jgi:transcription initiation factor IIE alpha subunit